MTSELRLVGVYSSRSGWDSVVAYIKGKLPGPTECALCDITHGTHPLGKPSWKKACNEFPISLSAVHLDEVDERTAAVLATTQAPTMILLSPEGDKELLSRQELKRCDKNPEKMMEMIVQKLEGLGISLNG